MTKAVRYAPHHQKQINRADKYGKDNCTAYCFAMFADATTIGGSRPTGKYIRSISDEPIPAPNSPGLNIHQMMDVAKKLAIPCNNKTGEVFAAVLASLRTGRVVLAQLDYKELASYRCQANGDFGHAMLLQTLHTDGLHILADDPLCDKAKYYPVAVIKAAMETFGHQAGHSGLFFMESRRNPKVAAP